MIINNTKEGDDLGVENAITESRRIIFQLPSQHRHKLEDIKKPRLTGAISAVRFSNLWLLYRLDNKLQVFL